MSEYVNGEIGARRHYVSAMDGTRRAPCVVGPFMSHAAALARVDDARRIAESECNDAGFAAFGTWSGIPTGPMKPGKLNAWFGLSPSSV